MNSADLLAWEWCFSGAMPKQREYKFDEDDIQARTRYLDFNHHSGIEIWFNYLQVKVDTARKPPHVTTGLPGPDNEIWMAFYPTKVDYRGTLFQQTTFSNYTLNTFIIQTPTGRYCLAPSIANAWSTIETRLDSIFQALRVYINFAAPVRGPVSPSAHGYKREYQTKEEAYEVARKSRNAFPFLQAYLSFLVSFWWDPRSRRTLDSLASWLSAWCKLDPSWMTMLLTLHPIAYTERVTRLGMTIDTESPWVWHLPLFLDCNVRVGVYTRKNDPNDMAPAFRRMFIYGGTWLCFDLDDCETCQKRLSPSYNPLKAEDFNDFIKAREIRWLEHVSKKNEVFSLAQKLGTEKHISVGKVEHQNGLSFRDEGWKAYEWVKIAGCYRRLAIAHSLMGQIIDSYPNHLRYFSPLDKEVDLCDAFLPIHLTPAPPPPPTLADASQDTVESEGGDFRRDTINCYSDDDDSDDEEDTPRGAPSQPSATAVAPTSLDPKWRTIFALRLGFEWDQSSDPPELEGDAAAVATSVFHDPNGLSKAMQVLGLLVELWRDSVTQRDRAWFTFALGTLLNKSLTLQSLPAPFDISTRNALILLGRFQIQQLKLHNGNKVTIRFALGIKNSPLSSQWFVVVVDALALLEIGRSGWTGVLDICRQLARRGIPFSTARYYPSSTSPTVRDVPRPGLGVVTTDQVSFEAYQLYTEQRDEYLAGPRGGVALRAGGLAWRFARDVVNIKNAALPPSKDAPKHGRILGRTKDGYVVIGDYVEPHELDKLLGSYLWLKEKRLQATITLWPNMAAWDSTGMNTGAWNEEVEHWYRRQVARYEAVDGLKAMGSKNWTNTTRGFGKAREIWKRYRSLATEYLVRKFPY